MTYDCLTLGDFQNAFTPIERASIENQESKLIIEPLKSETVETIKQAWLSHLNLELVLLDSADFIRAAKFSEADIRDNFKEIATQQETYFITELLKDTKLNFPY